jgi:PKD repeat protein
VTWFPPLNGSWRSCALLASCALVLSIAAFGVSAPKAFADVGYEGQSYTGTGTPTGLKRSESVLWWNDGSWWAHMWDRTSGQFHIFRLDEATQSWVDTGVTVETRPNTHADVLWDGTKLYVASHEFVAEEQPAVAGSQSYLFRFSYDPVAQTYSPDPGFPAVINDFKTETLVIDKDSTGKVWATWPQDNQIYVNRTVGDDLTWGTPFPLPVAANAVTVDDSSALVAFGNRIGVMWSNQTSANLGFWFAVHEDGKPDNEWEPSALALGGPGTADDHMNLHADRDGRVYAGVKTSHLLATAPLFALLVRDPATGAWSNHTVATVADCPTRPMIVIDEENRVVHAYATYPGPPTFSCSSGAGAIYEKTASLDAIAFPPGAGTPVIEDSDSPRVNNVSSTKQNVSSAMGIALLAVNTTTRRYWHNFFSILPAAPTADFSASPTTGNAPLSVAFTDGSTGSATSWSWDFGDGGTSAERNPTHTYTAPGTYTVTLTASNAGGGDTETKTGYITVSTVPDFSLAASPLSRVVVVGRSATYTVTVTDTGGFSGPVQLSVSGLVSGTSASFDPNPVVVPGTASTMTVTTTSQAKLGSHPLTITGTSGSLSRSTIVTLQVKRK